MTQMVVTQPQPHMTYSNQRSRNGCLQCRSRRKKCDESRPSCLACTNRGIDCDFASKPCERRPQEIRSREQSTTTGKRDVPNGDTYLQPQDISIVEDASIFHFRTHVLDVITFSPRTSDDVFFTSILPMVSDSVLIRSALEAASTAHLHNLGVVSTLEATRLQSKALRHLSGALSTATSRIDSTIFLEELVSATFLLVYYETALGLSAQTARWHLSAAKSILNSLTQNARQSQSLDSLIRIFLYFDLMVALSLRLEPLANLGMFASLVQRSFCPTFGYSLTLYPHLHSLTCLLAQKYISIDSDLWMDEKSVRELECDLLCWQPSTMPPETTAVWSSREDTSQWTTHQAGGELHERCLETALAFRSTALLVLTDELLPLFSATPSFPPNVHYTNLLNHLLRLNTLAQVSPPSATSSSTYLYPSSSTTAPTMTITWPLHTAALHAKSSSDRQLLSCLFEHVYHRHRMGMIRAARRQVEQVWCEDEKVKGRVDGGGRCRSLLEEDERRNGDVVEMAPLLA